jgi:hypothetical protein
MRKLILVTLIIVLFAIVLPNSLNGYNQYYFKFKVNDKSELTTLTKMISIDNVKGNTVWAYANDSEWAEFNGMGYDTELLPSPGYQENPVMRESGATTRLWDSYPTYQAYVDQMYAFQTNYPNLCQIIDAGTTVGGRKILFAKISDNVSTHETEPEVLYSSTMHGDETTGYILMLRLIDTLLSQYGTDQRLTTLVNNLEIWINPNANPDGTYYGGDNTVSGARRYNNNGYDLNRTFPDPWVTNSNPVQTENTIMMNLANAHHFALSANFHGGAEVANYPWDGIYGLHPDNNWWASISTAYATSAQNNSPAGYFDDLYSGSIPGVTNGAAWYVITGGRQDWHNYFKKGREITLEISSVKNPTASNLPNYWNYNYNSMLTYLENALYGLQGIVTNGQGQPLDATITVVGYDNAYSKITTDPVNGDFLRMLLPGTYTIEISTAGYPAQTFTGVVITAGQKTVLNAVFGDVTVTQNIPLTTGWNLVSLRVIPANLTLQSLFSGISGNVQQVKDNQLSYAPAMASHFNTLSTWQIGKGYWVKVNSNCTLSVTGTAVDPSAQTIALSPGWNLVSYYPGTAMNVSTALASISTYLQEVKSLSQSYIPGSGGNTLTQLATNNGYWIKVSQACTLTYPGGAR